MSGTVEVDVRSLDSLWETGEIGEPEFLKIDSEGFELEILVGGKRLLTDGPVRVVQFEFGEHHLLRGQTLAQLAAQLPGYRVSRLATGRLVSVDPLQPMESIPIFANYVAVR